LNGSTVIFIIIVHDQQKITVRGAGAGGPIQIGVEEIARSVSTILFRSIDPV
jgi:hypothetical protein